MGTSSSSDGSEHGGLAANRRHARAVRVTWRSIDHVAQTFRRKRDFASRGPASWKWRRPEWRNERAELGLAVLLRAMLSLTWLDEDMAIDFNAALRSDGHFDTMAYSNGCLLQTG